MLGVTVICIGKLKEPYWQQACTEYEKRLSRFCRLHICELPEAALPESPNAAQIGAALEREGQAILQALPKGAFTAALCIEGDALSSEQFAERLEAIGSAGNGRLCLIIGSSFGLSPAVKARCDLRLSFSKMTFPHQLFRVLLLEQLYRGFTILNHQKYHK